MMILPAIFYSTSLLTDMSPSIQLSIGLVQTGVEVVLIVIVL
jgi:hypothetical protein